MIINRLNINLMQYMKFREYNIGIISHQRALKSLVGLDDVF